MQGLENQAADQSSAGRSRSRKRAKAPAFDAHTGNTEAKQRLAELRGQETLAKQEAASLEIAIAEGKQRLAAAIAAETDAEERIQARMALGLVCRLCRTRRGARRNA